MLYCISYGSPIEIRRFKTAAERDSFASTVSARNQWEEGEEYPRFESMWDDQAYFDALVKGGFYDA